MAGNNSGDKISRKITWRAKGGPTHTIPEGASVQFTKLGGPDGLVQIEVSFSEDGIVVTGVKGESTVFANKYI